MLTVSLLKIQIIYCLRTGDHFRAILCISKLVILLNSKFSSFFKIINVLVIPMGIKIVLITCVVTITNVRTMSPLTKLVRMDSSTTEVQKYVLTVVPEKIHLWIKDVSVNMLMFSLYYLNSLYHCLWKISFCFILLKFF